ncbi:hypothetical protein Taro_029650 [Colocasia esculenta]|uniref:Uncharacterized protein n=1 Tax=Colocasia esculenta TaxID=4460 RepID=A0A843VTU1_COLES|nr:hypothetical protein [Colocasia esculenta]
MPRAVCPFGAEKLEGDGTGNGYGIEQSANIPERVTFVSRLGSAVAFIDFCDQASSVLELGACRNLRELPEGLVLPPAATARTLCPSSTTPSWRRNLPPPPAPPPHTGTPNPLEYCEENFS